MKNKTIAILKNQDLTQTEKYNALLDMLAKSGKNINALRSFQMGYSAVKLESLIHEVKKAYEISDLDIYNYQESDDEENNKIQEPTTASLNEGGQNADQLLDETKNPVFAFLAEKPEAQAGIKLRDEYPFLSAEDCPDEYKILVADKISAWKDFAKEHQMLALFIPGEKSDEDLTDEDKEKIAAFEALSDEEKQDALYNIAKATVADFQLNADIKDELDFYKETGKVLGKHPKLEYLKIKEEIFEMSEADLVKHRLNGQKNFSKAKVEYEADNTKDSAKKRMEVWEYRVKLATERLEMEFKHNFDQKK